MEQIKILKIVDKYAKGECTLGELLGEVKQYCDYHNDKLNESTRKIFELEIENSLMRGYIGEIFCHYKNAEKDGVKLTDVAIGFRERARQLLDYTALPQAHVSGELPLTEVSKCGKCEMLGDIAPCDECYRNGNYR